MQVVVFYLVSHDESLDENWTPSSSFGLKKFCSIDFVSVAFRKAPLATKSSSISIVVAFPGVHGGGGAL